jgi:hypothetical protein
MTASVLLTGDATLPQLSVEFDKCERTILRWMDAPDGLPYVERMSPPRTETGACVAPMITSRHWAASSSRACTWMPSAQK